VVQVLMENRSGLIVGIRLTRCRAMPNDWARFDLIAPRGDRPRAVTLGADKGYDTKDFVELRERHVRPARRPEQPRPALGYRPPHQPASRLCQEPAHPQADRGGVRLDQDGRRPEEDPLFAGDAGRPRLHLRGCRLQSGAAAKALGEKVSEKRCPEPFCETVRGDKLGGRKGVRNLYTSFIGILEGAKRENINSCLIDESG
jgi:hypothetical protein